MGLASFLATVASALNEAEIPFMLTGSLTASFYGLPRATQGIDLVIDSPPEKLQRLIDSLQAAGF